MEMVTERLDELPEKKKKKVVKPHYKELWELSQRELYLLRKKFVPYQVAAVTGWIMFFVALAIIITRL